MTTTAAPTVARTSRAPPPLNPPERLLMGPGPSNPDPRVLAAMGANPVGHLDPYFVELMDQTMGALRARLPHGESSHAADLGDRLGRTRDDHDESARAGRQRGRRRHRLLRSAARPRWRDAPAPTFARSKSAPGEIVDPAEVAATLERASGEAPRVRARRDDDGRVPADRADGRRRAPLRRARRRSIA